MASITDRHITSELTIRTLQKALEFQRPEKDNLILYGDQGSQYTSKAFIGFCELVHVAQNMSKAGYPYDNAPMERYFNTLKNECTNLYEFQTDEELYWPGENLPMLPTTMYAHTAIMTTVRHTRRGQPYKERWKQVIRLDYLITQHQE